MDDADSTAGRVPGGRSFSVVIPCYQQGRFLARAVESALGQTHPAAEVIVVDDGSTDDTAAVAQAFGERIRLLRQDNRGLSAARNSGLRASSGDFLVFLDADDWLPPMALVAHTGGFARGPDAALSCGGWNYVDEAGSAFSEPESVSFPDDAYHFLLGGNRMPCHAVAVRRSVLERVGEFDTSLAALEDWDLWLRIARTGMPFVSVPSTVACYRRYPGSMSRDVERILSSARAVFRKNGPLPGRRFRYWLAVRRAWRAIHYGLYCNALRPLGCRGALRQLARHPTLLEGGALHALFTLVPPLRRRLGVRPPEPLG